MKRSLGSVAALWSVLALTGCTMAAQEKDNLLVDAGFTRVKTDSPEWAATAKSLPPHRFVHRTVNGTPMVFFSEPVACRCVYSGTQSAFDAYRQVHREEVAAFDETLGGGSSFSR